MVTKHTEISLGVDSLNGYAGRYDAPGEVIFAINHEGDFLTIGTPAEWGFRNSVSTRKVRRTFTRLSCLCGSRFRLTAPDT
jgi:hypothetical protein